MYTLEEIAARTNHSRDWAYNTYIKPTEQHSKRRKTFRDDDGQEKPAPGVPHFREGSVYPIPGRALISWRERWSHTVEE
jgi:hypothetical protein